MGRVFHIRKLTWSGNDPVWEGFKVSGMTGNRVGSRIKKLPRQKKLRAVVLVTLITRHGLLSLWPEHEPQSNFVGLCKFHAGNFRVLEWRARAWSKWHGGESL